MLKWQLVLSLFIITLFLQVLEELEKLKGHCKDCEVKNEALLTERDALQQQLKVNVKC